MNRTNALHHIRDSIRYCLSLAFLLLLTIAGFASEPTPMTSGTPESRTHGLKAIGTYEVVEEDFVFASIDGLELRAHSYRPRVDGRLAAVVDVHGGAWNYYDRNAGAHYDKALASSGLYVFAIDFRQGPDFQHPFGSRDATGAVRYLKIHAARLQIDAGSIGIMGSSSGGHLALLAGVKPNTEAHLGTTILGLDGKPATADDIDAAVAYVVALWPVSDPAYRYQYAEKVGRERLIDAHDNYFGSVANMRDASIARIIDAGEAVSGLPAIFVVQPGEDANVPRPMTSAMISAYQNGGGKVDYAFYPGMPHGFAHRPSTATADCIEAIRDFIARLVK